MGTRPPVMLVHGMWSTSETLAELAQAFSEDHGFVDIRGRFADRFRRDKYPEQ